jgi:uncharacterized protein (TIGR04255 family)
MPYQIPQNKRLPRKITPCPIEEAIIEIRFELKPHIPEDAVFGLVFNAVGDNFPKVEKLQILELPLQIRSSDENLKYKPHYRLQNEKYILQIGPRVVSLVAKRPYQGWGDFYSNLKKNVESIQGLNIIESVKRLGLRYVDYFNTKVFDNIDLSITTSQGSLVTPETQLRTTLKDGQFNILLQVINDAMVSTNEKPKKGSVLDVDISLEKFEGNFFDEYKKLIENAHELEKRLFFSLLQDEFLKTLKPEYE